VRGEHRRAVVSCRTRGNNRVGAWNKTTQFWKYTPLSHDALILVAAVRFAIDPDVSEMVLHDAVEGKMGLTRRQWVRLGRMPGLPTTYILRRGERDGQVYLLISVILQ
jgi:hypothetical protein